VAPAPIVRPPVKVLTPERVRRPPVPADWVTLTPAAPLRTEETVAVTALFRVMLPEVRVRSPALRV
jgi:hypothetical protein